MDTVIDWVMRAVFLLFLLAFFGGLGGGGGDVDTKDPGDF
jgi:hypothetical protein